MGGDSVMIGGASLPPKIKPPILIYTSRVYNYTKTYHDRYHRYMSNMLAYHYSYYRHMNSVLHRHPI